MGVLDKCAKYFLFLPNILIFALSCSILALGSNVNRSVIRNYFLDLLMEQGNVSVPIYETAVILFLIVAFFAIFVSCLGCCAVAMQWQCLGCCGAYKIKWMLTVYSVVVFVLLVLIVVLGLLVLNLVGTIIGMTQGLDKLKDPFLDTLPKYDESRQTIVELTWDQTQTDFHCCGVDIEGDWARNNERYGTDGYVHEGNYAMIRPEVPASCCASSSNVPECQKSPTEANGAYTIGCWALIQGEVQHHADIIGGLSIAMFVLLTVNMITALYMCACGLDRAGYGRPHDSDSDKNNPLLIAL